ncbi:MAG: LLM class flavin-dependent oxidoreductase [Chloroflexi bacterium]|nr:LLM class flavin-dependent oxidoreductase [Chloroflexota bacterium]
MAGEIKVGLHIPAASDGPLPSKAQYIEFFRHAERLGFHGLWTEDRIFHNANLLEPLTLLTLAASATERMVLGTAVLLLSMRNAPELARRLSSLDYLSGGRVELGISLGGRPGEYPGLGMQQSERVPRLRENMLVLRALLRGEPVSHEGRFYDLDDAVVRPAAVREGGIPLYMGGHVEPVLRRTGELADGWIGGPFTPPVGYEACWQSVLEHARSFGRDPEQLEAGKLIYVAVDDDRDRALAALIPFLNAYYGPARDPKTFAVYGPAEEVASKLQEFVDVGTRTFMLGVPSLDVEHLERIAADVVPRLRETP